MIRLLLYIRKGFRFFKGIKIGIEIAIGAFKVIILDHKRYFFFCILLALIYYFGLIARSILDPKFSIGYFLTQTYMEHNPIELLIETIKSPITLNLIYNEALKIIIIFAETLISILITSWIVYFTFTKKNIFECFYAIIAKIPTILIWTIINIFVFTLTAPLPNFIGNTLELFWSLSTLLVIPIFTLNNISFTELTKRSLIIFKKRFSNFLGADILIDVILIILTAVFYYWYQNQDAQPFELFRPDKGIDFFVLAIICYLQGTLQVTQAIVTTSLYKLMYNQKFF